jgi:predicted oxidoreductase (fatty acid repression mutant protein)
MNNSEEYDVVIATLQEKKDKLWKMTESNMNMDMMNLMDDIRLEQIQELNEAMGMWLLWKEEKCQTERTETRE